MAEELTERQAQTLTVMEPLTGFTYAGRIAWLRRERFGGRYSQREDAGMTRTLDSLEKRGLVEFDFDRWNPSNNSGARGRTWRLTDVGRELAPSPRSRTGGPR